MFSELRVRYPNGSLTTELTTIHEGKYVVRALVTVEGIILVTSLGAAKSVEQAEDRAITRVLTILGIQRGTPTESAVPTQLTPAEVPTQLRSNSVETALATQASEKEEQPPHQQLFSERVSRQNVPQISVLETVTSTASSLPTFDLQEKEYSAEEESLHWEEEAEELMPVEAEHSSQNFDLIEAPVERVDELLSNPLNASLTPLPSYQTSEPVVVRPSSAEGKTRKTKNGKTPAHEPPDMSDVLARTTVEIRRLGWSDVQGKEYLLKTYGKKSRSLLNNQELLEFLDYLESQPTPNL